MGGGSDTVQQPTPPAQPSSADAIKAWVESMPQVYETQMEYAPKQAAQQIQLAQEYAQPYGQAMLQAQQAMYPTETKINDLAGQQALEGMQSQVPEWQRNQYQSNLNANLGTNAGSPMGADYMSLGLMQQQQDWQNYYRNLGLSLSGKQPVMGAQTPQTTDYMSNFSPNQSMDFMSSTYAPYASAYSNMYGSNASLQASNTASRNSMYGDIAGGIGGIFGGYLGGL